ncbi:hypothetical protein Dsin_012794 [Dipteronia sinensis]|uniref:Uncharacterized protein n=1 Tax=Dipteronia sinensis TaxID=43782 RepID=A0AAE0AJY7_9ROSI|nr:hypothetical protein Dsin_012794 [Dipteronia sinensis]
MDGGYMNAFTLLRGEVDKVSTTRLVKKAEANMAEREAKQEQQQQKQQSNDVVGEYESWDSSSSTIDEEEKESELEDKSVKEMIMKKKSNKSTDDRKKKVGGKSLLKGYGGNPNSKDEKEGRLKKWMRSQRRFLVKNKLWHEVLVLWKSFITFIVIALLMAVLPNKNELQYA